MESKRLRLTFARQGALRYIGHLDMVKTWERILRRARLPLAYSQGFHPQPKIQFASALPVGCSSVAELMDIIFAQPVSPDQALRALAPQLPDGMSLVSIQPAPPQAPALQAALQSAEYTLTIETPESAQAIRARIQALLDAPTLPRQRRGKVYDLRPLILDLRVQEPPPLPDEQASQATGQITLWARLRASQDAGAGRPDELLDALGLGDAPAQVCRTGLILSSA